MKDYSRIGFEYAEAVAKGAIANGKLAILACERALRDLKNQKTLAFPFRFDAEQANFVAAVIERLPHVKGDKERQLIELEPWQCFIVTQAFGWIHSGGLRDGLRRFRKLYIEVGRGNGKSTLISGIAIYMLSCEGQADVYCAATTRDQAKIVWKDAHAMVGGSIAIPAKTRAMVDQLGIECHANSIIIPSKNSKFVPMSSEASTADGLNISLGILDECHAHPTRDLWDVISTGCGKRANSMLLGITTAGFNRSSVCYEQHGYVKKVLQEVVKDESLFGCIWAADEEDDWRLPEVWKKANPNYGISVDPSYLEDQARAAEIEAGLQNTFRTKHLCQWVSASSAWMDMRVWDNCTDKIKLEDFAGEECYIGLDLASVSDLVSKIYLFPVKIQNKDQGSSHFKEMEQCYYMFSTNYLSEAAIRVGKNAQYDGWATRGYITQTQGDVTDYGQVEDELSEDLKKFKVKAIAFDPWQAQQMMQRLMAGGANVVEVRAGAASFSEPMKELERLARTKRLHHDGNPVLAWAASNVVCYVDKKDNIYPNKEAPENKIDPIVAAIMAMSQAMLDVIKGPSIYETRGVATLDVGRPQPPATVPRNQHHADPDKPEPSFDWAHKKKNEAADAMKGIWQERGVWYATIPKNGKVKFLGMFGTMAEAMDAKQRAMEAN
jgi:phage terminase large subunit-like protein